MLYCFNHCVLFLGMLPNYCYLVFIVKEGYVIVNEDVFRFELWREVEDVLLLGL